MLDKQQITSDIDVTIDHLDLIIDELSTVGKPDEHELKASQVNPEVIQAALAEGGAAAEHLGACCRIDRAVKEIRQEMERLEGLRKAVEGAFAGTSG